MTSSAEGLDTGFYTRTNSENEITRSLVRKKAELVEATVKPVKDEGNTEAEQAGCVHQRKIGMMTYTHKEETIDIRALIPGLPQR